MQAITLDLNNDTDRFGAHPVSSNIKLSLNPFIEYVQGKIAIEKTAKVNFYKYILDQFSQYPELKYPIEPQDAKKYSPLFELIYTCLSPIINDENHQYWAISTPVSPFFHYGTDAFYNVFMESSKNMLKTSLGLPPKSSITSP
jgi:hypothetical protein